MKFAIVAEPPITRKVDHMLKVSFLASARSIIPIAAVSFLAVSTSANARDCRNVTFEFINQTGGEVRIRTVDAVGNNGPWTENVGNMRLDHGDSETTNGRRMNRLDEGRTGSFFVNYDSRRNGSWAPKQSNAFRYQCSDDDNLEFVLVRTEAQETGTCKRVRFAFLNNTGSLVRLRRVNVTPQGSNDTRTENVSNHEIEPGLVQFTARRRLRGLRDGQSATYQAIFRKFNSATQKFENSSATASSRCSTGGQIGITLR